MDECDGVHADEGGLIVEHRRRVAEAHKDTKTSTANRRTPKL